MKILIVGASGFIGFHVCKLLLSFNYDIVALTRNPRTFDSLSVRYKKLIILDESCQDTFAYLDNIDVVIYASGIAHVQSELSNHIISLVLNVNLSKPLLYAQKCLKHKVKKFIFISSAKVHGEISTTKNPFYVDSPLNPCNLYSISKQLCEESLHSLFMNQESNLAIVRVPLVYGPNSKGNIRKFINIASLGFPLPIGSLDMNLRSYISIYNLCDFLIAVINYRYSFNHAFLIADKKPLSTKEFVEKIILSNNIKLKTFSFPPFLLRVLLILLNKKLMFEKLCHSFVVNSSYAENFFNWVPPLSFEESLQFNYDD